MTNPKHISILDFTYSLPLERIANYPLVERDSSKLLVYKEGLISDSVYSNISSHIPGNSLLIFNNTRVIPARLLFQKITGGIIEIFCLEPHEQYRDIASAMRQKGNVLWNCLVGGASKWKPGQTLEKKINNLTLSAKYIDKQIGQFTIELSWLPGHFNFAEILQQTGATPLPPYIKREAEQSDKECYQTVYAGPHGSVAAPTAGLHFTESIFTRLTEKNITRDFITLHVGAGTFKPVKAATMAEHGMHAEWIDVSRETIENILSNLDNPIVAVGTTSLRAIESLYWMGVKGRVLSSDWQVGNTGLFQWEAYELAENKISAGDALQSLLDWMVQNKMERLVAKTQILIAPGYEFKIVKGLITNFHQPQSTLLLLVAALIGDDWRKVYDHALQNEFRFLSYGDGCLLWKKEGCEL